MELHDLLVEYEVECGVERWKRNAGMVEYDVGTEGTSIGRLEMNCEELLSWMG